MKIILKIKNEDKEKQKDTIDKSLKILWQYFKDGMEDYYENKLELDALYNILEVFREYKIK